MLEEADQVTEYTIGVDVFGKPENFKESKDSNVRVEIHRLRKRLAQYYLTEGMDRSLRLIIPSGRYTPEFTGVDRQSEESSDSDRQPPQPLVASLVPVTAHNPASLEVDFRHVPAGEAMPRRGLYALAAITIAAVVAGTLLFERDHLPSVQAKISTPVQDSASKSAAFVVPGSSSGAVRIMAGYSGPAYTDGSGFVWGPDQYFEGGRPARRTDARTARTNNPLLFQNSRIGDFSYAIPLSPGNYELHLYFIESEYGPEFGNGENDRTIFIHLNGQRLVPEIDIESDAMGSNVADERVFKDVQPGSDGKLHIAFESGKGVPLVNAIEVLPGNSRHQLPIRQVAQPVPFTSHDGLKWQPDNYYLNGRVVQRNLVVTGTPDPGLFAMERYGHFTYAIPVDVRGRYTVTLHFAELYYGESGVGGVGSRVFNVLCNGVLLLDNFDIFKEAGSARALTKTFHHMKPTAQGKLNLMFEPVVNYALVSGIEVLDESN